MQTFLPFADYEESARVLDNKRLGKQRVEALQIIKALTLPEYGWKNHPATKMWRGHEHAFADYGAAMCDEWIRRGYVDTCKEKMFDQVSVIPLTSRTSTVPFWFGNEEIHASHRSNLLRKHPDWYSQFGWSEPDDLPYVWPV